LNTQANLCLGAYIEAGRKDEKSFNVISKNIRQLPGIHGLSNSEIFLASALWAVHRNKIEIEHINLNDYFNAKNISGRTNKSLINNIRSAEGIILSGPVYFGDRSSLAQEFIQLLRNNSNIIKDKIFAGLAVGAKRNGGQETCLIYQMLDFINLDFLGVGNDSNTTAQYGGTGHAGDVGSGAYDEYGIDTSIGTGNRISSVVYIKKYSDECSLNDKVKIGIIILQDREGKCKEIIEKCILRSGLQEKADIRVFYFVQETIERCIACDMCPSRIGMDDEYRCIIKKKKDLFVKYHKELIDLDAILIGGYSSNEFQNIKTVYQRFMERTRYLRRSDYIFSDYLVAPIVFTEIESNENLATRIFTSMIRHHTIIHKPISPFIYKDKIVNLKEIIRSIDQFIRKAAKISAGRIFYHSKVEAYSNYNPLGYKLKTENDWKPENIQKRYDNMANRREHFKRMFKGRIQNVNTE